MFLELGRESEKGLGDILVQDKIEVATIYHRHTVYFRTGDTTSVCKPDWPACGVPFYNNLEQWFEPPRSALLCGPVRSPDTSQSRASALVRNVKQNLAPRGELSAAHKRPPCDSTMERLIRNPMPVP